MLTEADIQTVKAKAEQGDANCQFRLAVHYLTDTNEGPRPQAAYEWIQRSARASDQDAACLLEKLPSWPVGDSVPTRQSLEWAVPGLVMMAGLGIIVLLVWVMSPSLVVTDV